MLAGLTGGIRDIKYFNTTHEVHTVIYPDETSDRTFDKITKGDFEGVHTVIFPDRTFDNIAGMFLSCHVLVSE